MAMRRCDSQNLLHDESIFFLSWADRRTIDIIALHRVIQEHMPNSNNTISALFKLPVKLHNMSEKT